VEVYTMGMMGPGMMGNWGYGMMGGYGYLGIFFWILLIVGVVLLVIWLVRKAPQWQQGRVDESAMDILKKRYAKGEINREEFEEMKKNIS
jgi:putative membrane protein